MPQIQLSEKAFRVATDHARAGGYESVDAYVSDIVIQDGEAARLFDDAAIRELDGISGSIRAGAATHSIDDLRKHFSTKR